jgi:hypothetical protein
MKNHEKRLKKERYATRMTRLRSATVEPVLGTLINFMNMKRVNTRGIEGAEKHVLMAALCYNLKKYLKFTAKKVKTQAVAMRVDLQTAFFVYFS